MSPQSARTFSTGTARQLAIAALARDAAAGAGVERIEIGLGVVFADRVARLHRRAGDAVAPAFELHDMRRLGECRIGRRFIPDIDIDHEVRRRLVPDFGGAGLERIGRHCDCGQHLVIDVHQLGTVLGLIERLGDHNRDRFADIANLVGGQHRLRPGEGVEAGANLHGDVRRPDQGRLMIDRLQAVSGVILAGEHDDHAGRSLGRFRVDAADAGMGMMRAHHRHEARVRRIDIGDVIALAGEKSLVFLALHRLTDATRRFAPLDHFLLTPPLLRCH
jgi:hypothetical protein